MDLAKIREKIDHHIARAEHYDAILSEAEDEAMREVSIDPQLSRYNPLWLVQRLAKENNEYQRAQGKRNSHLRWAEVYSAQYRAHVGDR